MTTGADRSAAAGEPVVVVGAGPVGQTAALLLARWGLRVVVLDRRPRRDAIGSKAICQARDVLDVWESVGVGAAVAREGVTWTTARTFYRDREISVWSFVDRGRSPFPPYVNLSQARTEALLDERIAAEPLIEVRWGHELTGIEQDVDGVDLHCRVGEEGDGGAQVTVRAAHAVLCSGARSDAVRRDLGLTFEGRGFDDAFLICDIRADLPGWERERRFYFDPEWNPGRQVLIHACPDSVFRIDWQVPPGYDLASDTADGGLDRRIRQIVGERPYEIVWNSVYRFSSRHVPRMRVGRVLLAGDAAHLVSPFGARGLNTGVFDAENLAWKIAFVERGWAPPELLESYSAERVAATLENIEVTSATMDFLVPQTDDELRRRVELLEAAAHDPDAALRIDSGRFAEPFWYVDSPLTTPDPDRPFAGRPPKGRTPPPAPGVVVPDVPIDPSSGSTRLRELVRRGFTVLVHEAGAGEADAVRAVPAARVPLTVASTAELSTAAGAGPAEDLVALDLGSTPGEAWLVRPDGYVAAVVRVGAPGWEAGLTGALDRALGRATHSPATSDAVPVGGTHSGGRDAADGPFQHPPVATRELP